LTQHSLGQIDTFDNEALDLSGNDIESLDVNQFINFTKLDTLILSKNKNFDFVPNQKFLIAKNLKTFKCETCNITRIYKETFEGKIVFFFKLILQSFEILKIAGLESIQILDLSDNKITEIGDGAFETNKQLFKIDLSINSLKVINPELFTPTIVKILKLDDNKNMKFLAQKYLATKELVTLELKGIGFTEITAKMLTNLPKLQQLDLSENEITAIELGAFDANTGLTELLLNDNSLTKFDPQLIAQLSNLTVFCLDDNKFIRNNLNHRLQKLYIERNYRSNCNGNMKQKFESLDLSPQLEPKNSTEETSLKLKENLGISYTIGVICLAIFIIISTVFTLVVLIWRKFGRFENTRGFISTEEIEALN
jgi:Leucine-rich repeat (LRR) protein